MFESQFKEIVGQLIWGSGINDNVLEQMLKSYEKGILQSKDFLVIRFEKGQQLDQELTEKVLTALLNKNDKQTLFVATEIASSFYRDKEVIRQMPKELIFKLLTRPEFFNDRIDSMHGYYWGELAKKYIATYPEYELAMFKSILSGLENHNFMILKSNSPFHSIAEKIARKSPNAAWEVVKSLLDDIKSQLSWRVLDWLGEDPGFGGESGIRPLTYFPVDAVMAWVEENPGDRAPAIMREAPKTLDKDADGWITREILHRYGHIDGVRSALSSNLGSDGWSGPASEHYRNRRDQARAWLKGETSRNVIEWIEGHIDRLTARIESEEISEEREY